MSKFFFLEPHLSHFAAFKLGLPSMKDTVKYSYSELHFLHSKS